MDHGIIAAALNLFPTSVFVLGSVAIPALAYFGTIFTFANQVSDYNELQRSPKIRDLHAFQVIEKPKTAGTQPDPRPSWADKVASRMGGLLPTFDSNSSHVRGNISRHTPWEYFFAGAMLSLAYLMVGLFITKPWPDAALKLFTSYGFLPFLNVERVSPDQIGNLRTSITPIFWAYTGAYFYALQSLSLRIDSRDATPGHFYSLTVRLVLSVSIALLAHHLLFGIHAIENRFLPILYFMCGLFPQPLLDWLWKKIRDKYKIESASQPQPLLDRIDGLNETQIGRLHEVGIDSAYALAVCDPIRTFVRLPYRLSQVVDWVAQAQLVLHFGDTSATTLRKRGFRTILDLAGFFAAPENCITQIGAIEKDLEMTADTLAIKWVAISATQPFVRLQELARALADGERTVPTTLPSS